MRPSPSVFIRFYDRSNVIAKTDQTYKSEDDKPKFFFL